MAHESVQYIIAPDVGCRSGGSPIPFRITQIMVHMACAPST